MAETAKQLVEQLFVGHRTALLSFFHLNPGTRPSAGPVRSAPPRHGFHSRLGLAVASVLVVVGGLLWWRVLPYSDSHLAVHFGRNVRQADLLNGQLYREVAPDPSRPFEALTVPVHVGDVGTHFEVYRREALAEVTILKRTVSDHSPSGTIIGRAGQQATVPIGGGTLRVRNVDAEEAVPWRSGRLVFRQRPLLEVVEEFNRYSPVRIEIDSPGLGDMPVSGVISTRDFTSFMAFLNNLPGVKVTPASGHISVTRDD